MRRALLTQLSDAPEPLFITAIHDLHAETVPRADLVAYVTRTQSGRKTAQGGVTVRFANTSNTRHGKQAGINSLSGAARI